MSQRKIGERNATTAEKNSKNGQWKKLGMEGNASFKFLASDLIPIFQIIP